MTAADGSPPERGGTFRSLRVRNFRLFFAGQLISQVGNWLTLVAQTLLVLELTDSGVALGLLAAAQFGPVLLFGAFAGLLADRSDKRKLLLGVQTFAMFQSFLLAGLAFMGDPPVAAIYAVAVLGGVATAFDNPARRSFVVEIVPVSDTQQRRQPEQRADDRRPRRGTGARRPGMPPRATMMPSNAAMISEVLDRLRLLDLGDHRQADALLVHDPVDVARCPRRCARTTARSCRPAGAAPSAGPRCPCRTAPGR